MDYTHGNTQNDTPLAQAVKFFLDHGAVVAAVPPGAKNPRTTRPAGQRVPWRVHLEEGHLGDGIGRLLRGEEDWLPYFVYGSFALDGVRLAGADVDAGGAAAEDLKRVCPRVLVDWRKPGAPERAHISYLAASPPGSGELFVEGFKVGEWRAQAMDRSSEGAGMRCYPGELEALHQALLPFVDSKKKRPVQDLSCTRPRPWSSGVKRAIAQISGLSGGDRNPGLLGVLRPLERVLEHRAEFERALCDAYAARFSAGELMGRSVDDELRKALDTVQTTKGPAKEGKPKQARARKAVYEEVTALVGGDTLAPELAKHGVEVRYNERWLMDEVRMRPGGAWEPVTDRNEARCKVLLNAVDWEVRVWDTLWRHTLYAHSTDPLRDWLEGLQPWDGTPRVDFWAERAFKLRPGKDNLAMARWGSRHVFMGSAGRTLTPGLALDTNSVIHGPQEVGKSKHLEWTLPPEHRDAFGDELNLSARPKDMLEAIQGKMLVEIAEMSGLDRAKLDVLKAFMTRTVDSGIRLAYRRNPEYAPRRCVFVGTVNDDGTGVLPDDNTGHRRWGIFSVIGQGMHWDELMADRDQYWAEAVHRIRQGEDPSFPAELRATRAATTEMHRRADALEEVVAEEADPVRRLMKERAEFEAGVPLTELFGIMGLRGGYTHDKDGHPTEEYRKTIGEVSDREAKRLARALRAQGWGKQRVRLSGSRLWVWAPPKAGE